MVESDPIRPAFLSYARFFLYLLYFFEAGLFLAVAPWSQGWDEAVLYLCSPDVASFLRSGYVRGGVSAMGAIHVVWGLLEATGAARAARGAGG
jgi:hypothetical protein